MYLGNQKLNLFIHKIESEFINNLFIHKICLTHTCVYINIHRLLMQSKVCNMPLFNGFYSNYVQDSLPKTVVTYMETILKSTNNDVVQETML